MKVGALKTGLKPPVVIAGRPKAELSLRFHSPLCAVVSWRCGHLCSCPLCFLLHFVVEMENRFK